MVALLAWKGEHARRADTSQAEPAQLSSAHSRCYHTDTKALVAVKSMPKEHRVSLNYLLTNEVHTLISANAFQVPRVNTFIDQGLSASGDRCLILGYASPLAFMQQEVILALAFKPVYLRRLVEGCTLGKRLLDRSSLSKADNEQQMLAVASQMLDVRPVSSYDPLHRTHCPLPQAQQVAGLSISHFIDLLNRDCGLQTLNHMHMDSKVCHLDITPGNIMLQFKPANPWDVVRFIDFGFGTKFEPGTACSGHKRIWPCFLPYIGPLPSFSSVCLVTPKHQTQAVQVCLLIAQPLVKCSEATCHCHGWRFATDMGCNCCAMNTSVTARCRRRITHNRHQSQNQRCEALWRHYSLCISRAAALPAEPV